jgi:hypothetical protein
VTVPFRNLDVGQRRRALALAWRGPTADLRPDSSFFGRLFFEALGLSAFAALILVGFGPAREGWGIAFVLLGTVIPAGVAFGRAFIVRAPLIDGALRRAGVTFVNVHADAWRETAGSKCEAPGLDQFKMQEPSKQAYALPWYDVASALASDMPPRQTDLTVLAVGEFVGFHSGYVIDLKAISEAHASETDPDVVVRDQVKVLIDEAQVRQREAHYRDIVNIDYLPEGTIPMLRLGLSNGQTIQYPTLKAGSRREAALEHIRKRTREAKLRDARAPS